MADEVRDAAHAAFAAGVPAVVVAITAHRGSVPRETGTRMLVRADAVVGTIGGGHLELQAVQQARAMLRGGDPGPCERHVALGPSLGQCCGGALDLRFTLLSLDDPAAWPLPHPRFQLQLYGAGHVGRAIVRVLEAVPCRVAWIDERESEFPPGELPPHIRRVCVEPVEAEVAEAAPGSAFLVLTHSHDLDLRIAQAILARGDFGFFGLIGSATKRAKFERRLAERGVAAELIARMHCPIGLPGLRGKEPGVLAVAAVAQLLLAHPA
jgi:xanthine dehydrogenase accessory factor